MTGPERKVVGVNGGKLVVEVGDVVDETQIFDRVQVRYGSWVDLQGREREDARRLPLRDGCLNLRRPHEVWLVRCGRAVSVEDLYVVVRAAAPVFGAATTG